jgi:hypothetical protein
MNSSRGAGSFQTRLFRWPRDAPGVRWITLVLRVYAAIVVLMILSRLAALFVPLPTLALPPLVLGIALIAAILGLSLFDPWVHGSLLQVTAPLRHEPVKVRPNAEFEWEPVNEPGRMRAGLQHRRLFYDVPESKVTQQVSFEVGDSAQPRIDRAVKRGLRAATRALPGSGKVRARGWERDRPGPTTFVRVRLEIQGPGADRAWMGAARDAFAAAFVDDLRAKGHEARSLGPQQD